MSNTLPGLPTRSIEGSVYRKCMIHANYSGRFFDPAHTQCGEKCIRNAISAIHISTVLKSIRVHLAAGCSSCKNCLPKLSRCHKSITLIFVAYGICANVHCPVCHVIGIFCGEKNVRTTLMVHSRIGEQYIDRIQCSPCKSNPDTTNFLLIRRFLESRHIYIYIRTV